MCLTVLGLSGSGAAVALPVPLSAGLRGPAGLPAATVRDRVGLAQADGPGRRQRGADAVPEQRRLHPAVPSEELHGALLVPRSLRGPQREEEHLQRLQVRNDSFTA